MHRRNLASLGGPVPFGLAVFWVVISFIGSILQLAGLVRGGGSEKRDDTEKERTQQQLTFPSLSRPSKKTPLQAALQSYAYRFGVQEFELAANYPVRRFCYEI